MHISQHVETARQARKAARPVVFALSENVIASSGVTFHLWRLYQHAWLVCLLFPLAQLVREPISLGALLLRGLSLIGFAVGYTWLMWPHPASPQTRARTHSWLSFLLFGVLFALVLALCLLYGSSWLWLCIGMSAIAGALFPLRSAFVAVVCLTLFPLFFLLLVHGGIAGGDLWWLIAFLLLVRGVGLDMIGIARMGSAIRELHSTRRELARMKVEEERLRLARDLHDVLGQTLSMITLKSELARSLITEDPTRCARELAEIEQVSRQMLREARKTIASYRQPTLANELDGARQLLEAAGIAYAIEHLSGELPPTLDVVLGWTVREGVTNVVRHSHARHCLLRFTQQQGMIGGEILNDGVRASETSEKCARAGTGLPGLQERVSTLGGTMEAKVLTVSGKPHFRLCVDLPMQVQAGATSRQEK